MKKLLLIALAVLVVLPVFGFMAVSFAVQVYCLDGCGDPNRADSLTSDFPVTEGVSQGLYRRAAERFGIPWEVLAGVGRVECRHGLDPRCYSPNEAGAEGPMQFLPATFERWSWAADDPFPSPYNPEHAVHAAAAKLAADGVNRDVTAALLSYNRSSAYVADVLAWALWYGWSPPGPALLVESVLHHPRIGLRPAAAEDVRAGRVDPRVLTGLLYGATEHRLSHVGPLVSGHDYYVAGTDRPSNHAFGRAVDIPVVDGKPVSKSNRAAQDVIARVRYAEPDEIGSPWPEPVTGPVTFTKGHGDHLHFGWRP